MNSLCNHILSAAIMYENTDFSVLHKSAQHDRGFSSLVCQMATSHGISHFRDHCQTCMPACTSRSCVALVLTFDTLQVASEAHASTDLAGDLSQDPDKASPSSTPAPTAHVVDPSTCCLSEPNPIQAVIKVSTSNMGCKCIHGLPLHHRPPV